MARKPCAPAAIRGIIPPLVTPFADDETIDEAALRLQVRHMMSCGVHGIVVGGSAGEGFTLTLDELRRIVAVTAEEVNGSLPLIPGIIVNSTREAVLRAKALADLGVDALQITPPHYIFRTDDDAMLQHFRDIHAEVGLPILIYNVVPWNYLSPALLLRIMREVPGVIGVKQSAGDLKLLSELVTAARADERILGAIDALVYPCLAVGAHGMISQILAALPRPCVRMWDLVEQGNHREALDLHKRMLQVWNAISSDNRVAVTKYTLSLQGVPTGRTRRPLTPASERQKAAVRAVIKLVLNDDELAAAA
ncbi:dihydrodipicolinate synthase family protein [Vineibacter terrae]|uniref:dihydrodipicolinate synthase family protein n=1 Tax=Vineibacter terrae TaxID=2586908 RepID=UPI002E3706EA|nr:dihydrodipicolinate synthase family protein [Vineibacter terrae]HEX2891021.1 dihydrodipicolinate synthase family protein [Vineibacter terrae]